MPRKNLIRPNNVRRIAVVCLLVAGLWLGASVSAQGLPAADEAADLAADSAVVGALGFVGVPYRWGGNTPGTGFDCSGFVRYVFQNTMGLELPRRAVQMSRVGQRVSISQLQPGDLVFFHTLRRAISHVGIYIGDNKFIHSPSTGHTIRIDRLTSGYWGKRLASARRLSGMYLASHSTSRSDPSVKRTTQTE